MLKDANKFKLIYFLIITIFVILLTFLLVKLFPIYGSILAFFVRLLMPFIIACFIAYLLYPIVTWLEQYKFPNVLSILLIYLLFIGGTIYLVYRVYPALIIQLRDLNEHLPQFIKMYEDTIYQMYVSTSFLPEAVHDQMDQFIFNIETSLENFVGKLMNGFTKIFDFIVIITVIPVLVFYFLKDYQQIKKYFKRFIPIKYRQVAGQLIGAIDASLGGYIRGQLLVSGFVSLLTLIIFHLFGVKYALLLAIIMGLTNIIPYFGPIIGAIPAVALTITVSTKLTIIVIIAVFVIQIIESNFISPYIVGKTMNIHPIAIIFALLLGGQIHGIIGMIVAVPALTILKEVLSHLFIFQKAN